MLVFFSFSNYPSIILKIVVRKIKASIEIRYAKLENENIMNFLVLIYILSFLSLLSLSQAIPLPEAHQRIPSINLIQNGIVRSYLPDGVLTSADEVIILDLTKKRGIERVAKIVTHYMLPSSAKAIRVEGITKKEGREVSRKILSITYKEWTFPEARPGKNDLILGDFWAGKVYVRKQFELKVNGKSYLCSSVTGMSFEEAEALLAMFLNKGFKTSGTIRKNALEQVDWSQPTRFTKRGDRLSVGFLAKGRGAGFFDLTLKKENEGFTILQMMQAMP